MINCRVVSKWKFRAECSLKCCNKDKMDVVVGEKDELSSEIGVRSNVICFSGWY